MKMKEGFADVDGYKTWYGIAGKEEGVSRLPLLVLHGGPGLPHDYLEPLVSLADSRRVIFYDQLGCGRSARPDPGYPWSVRVLVDQVALTRRALGLDGPILLYGQSFGGFLALEHVLTGAAVAGLVLANTAASMARASEGLRALRATYASPDGDKEFMKRHFIGGDGVPAEPVGRAFASFGSDSYSAIWGTEAVPNGPLASWGVTDRLNEIDIPTLVFNGRDDQLTPECGRELHEGILGSEFLVFEGSAHLPFFTEPRKHHRVVGEFPAKAERQWQKTG